MPLNPESKKKPWQWCPWYRFSRYEIRDGRIAPAANARATRYSLLQPEEPSEDRRTRNASRSYARLIQTVTDSLDIDDDEDTDDPSGPKWTPIVPTRRPRKE